MLTSQLSKNEDILEKIRESKGDELFFSQKLQFLEDSLESMKNTLQSKDEEIFELKTNIDNLLKLNEMMKFRVNSLQSQLI